MNEAQLAEKIERAEGIEDPTEFMFDSIVPNICTTCEGVADGEPDATENWCETCGTNTCVSYLVLLGVI